MAITLHLLTEQHNLDQDNAGHLHVVASHQGGTLATTALAALPNRAQALAQPYTHGPALFAALGGADLLALLNLAYDYGYCSD